MNKLYLITGPAGVGKSTVSKMVANKLDKSVLIEGDDIYNQFVSGRISPWKENAPLDLFWENCISLIDNYLKNGYNVVFNYIIKKDDLKYLKCKLKKCNMVFVVLLVNEETLIKRDKERPVDCQMGERSLVLFKQFNDEKFDRNNILDTSKLSVTESADVIISEKRFEISKMEIDKVKTPEDILKYMEDNIEYGWLDIYNQKHIGNMQNFRRLYRTSSIEEIKENKFGTCIEQVWIMKYLFDKLNIKSKMFCTRIYEKNDFDKLDAEEHMHCFILYYVNNNVYHIEHPNYYKIGIYKYDNEVEAVNEINNYFINLSGGVARPVTEYFEVNSNLTFKAFNNYINSLDNK